MFYIPSATELYISNTLIKKGINCIWDMNIRTLSEAFNIKVKKYPGSSAVFKTKKKTYILLNDRLDEQEEYEDFLHELAHYIMDHTSVMFLEEEHWNYYELKAEHVLRYIAIPYFLIDVAIKLETVEAVSDYFFVSYNLAYKRLMSIRNKVIEYDSDLYEETIFKERRV